MRISDWSSDVCSSDLPAPSSPVIPIEVRNTSAFTLFRFSICRSMSFPRLNAVPPSSIRNSSGMKTLVEGMNMVERGPTVDPMARSEEHTSELQSLMRTSYAVFCLNKTNILHTTRDHKHTHTQQ